MNNAHPLQQMLDAAAAMNTDRETRYYRVTVSSINQVSIREEALVLPKNAVRTCFEFVTTIGDSIILWSMHDKIEHDVAYWLAAHVADQIGWRIGWSFT